MRGESTVFAQQGSGSRDFVCFVGATITYVFVIDADRIFCDVAGAEADRLFRRRISKMPSMMSRCLISRISLPLSSAVMVEDMAVEVLVDATVVVGAEAAVESMRGVVGGPISAKRRKRSSFLRNEENVREGFDPKFEAWRCRSARRGLPIAEDVVVVLQPGVAVGGVVVAVVGGLRGGFFFV